MVNEYESAGKRKIIETKKNNQYTTKFQHLVRCGLFLNIYNISVHPVAVSWGHTTVPQFVSTPTPQAFDKVLPQVPNVQLHKACGIS